MWQRREKNIADFLGIRGFTLIEVLVSMMVMAVSLTVIMGLFSGGLRSKRVSEDFNQAIALARNRMEAVLALPLKENTTLEGSLDDRFHWMVEITKQERDGEKEKLIKPLNFLYRVIVGVTWTGSKGEKTFTLITQQAESDNG